jgi:hypothetical protein
MDLKWAMLIDAAQDRDLRPSVLKTEINRLFDKIRRIQ